MALIISALGAVVSFYVSHLLNGITTEKDDEAKIASNTKLQIVSVLNTYKKQKCDYEYHTLQTLRVKYHFIKMNTFQKLEHCHQQIDIFKR